MTAVLESRTGRVGHGRGALPPLASWPGACGAFAVDVLLPARGDRDVGAAWPDGAAARLAVVGLRRRGGADIRGDGGQPVAAADDHGLEPGQGAVRHRRAQAGRGAGRARCAWSLRDLAHLLDTAALFIGWLWPLWDRRNRTFADLLLRTEVHDVERPQRDMRRADRRRRWSPRRCCAPRRSG